MNENWTLIYRGNETQYQLKKELIERANLTFRLFVANRYGRLEDNYTQLEVHIDRKLKSCVSKSTID